ncbi:hypothetical protein [Thalassobacillus sp. B23F22_16]|uniref:hypothetical protein n=1 Tax=Thalassobacillus sp. B23F22_16 TaxID=3459513 RepID=UPI00373F51C0
MNTCGFCASDINDKYCNFCQMELDDKHIMQDGKRLNQAKKFLGYPDRTEVYKSTKELMKLETIHLLCLLREARSIRAEVYKLRLLRHQAEEQQGMNNEIESLENYTYDEYESATRKVWVIENIIKDRLGYFPQKVTNNFLNMYLERMEQSEKKKMFMKKTTN